MTTLVTLYNDGEVPLNTGAQHAHSLCQEMFVFSMDQADTGWEKGSRATPVYRHGAEADGGQRGARALGRCMHYTADSHQFKKYRSQPGSRDWKLVSPHFPEDSSHYWATEVGFQMPPSSWLASAASSLSPAPPRVCSPH